MGQRSVLYVDYAVGHLIVIIDGLQERASRELQARGGGQMGSERELKRIKKVTKTI